MEKLSKEEMLAGKFLREAGLEKPSAEFTAKVMNTIAVRKVVKEYKPLISNKGWMFIFSLVGILFLSLFLVNYNYSAIYNFNFLQTFSIPKIELSQTMTLAIAFIGLFLLEIPFLKNLLERQVT